MDPGNDTPKVDIELAQSDTAEEVAPPAASAETDVFTGAAEQQADAQADTHFAYDFTVDLDSDNTHANVIRMVGNAQRVLELGPASGYMSEILARHGCEVVGIELDPDMAAQARQFCERVIVGDLDELDLDAELHGDTFDVIVAADVLEHLKDPLAVLRRLRAFLRPGGHFVVSLPNIAHASVRIALLQGRFDYRDLGLLDRTHLRFFTHASISQLFDDAELAVVEVHRQEAPIDTTEIAVDLDAIPHELIEELEQDPDARTYQFIVKALALEAPGLRELQLRLRESALARDAIEQELKLAREAAERQLTPHIQELESALAAITGREGQVRVALIEAHDQILRRDEQIEELVGKLRQDSTELEHLRDERKRLDERCEAHAAQCETWAAQCSAREEEARTLRVRLERILSSPPARVYARLGRLPLLRRVVARRTAGYQQALGEASRSGE
jgi:2-polyprenyl-3-methyl-5-hydroxy-6-metoxy-1,4-benzoquinol methylase